MAKTKKPGQSGRITIRRAAHDADNPYVMIRKASMQVRGMSFDTRGLLGYLLTKPEDWEVHPTDLMKEGACGRDRVYRMLGDLRARGFVELIDHRDPKTGRHTAYEYIVHESPLPENPHAGEPDTANPDHTNNGFEPSNDLTDDPPDGGQSPKPKRKRKKAEPATPTPREPTPIRLLAEALSLAFGLPIDDRSPKDASAYYGVAKDLHAAQWTPDDIPGLCEYVALKAREGAWTAYTVNVLPKWAGQYRAWTRSRSNGAPVPEEAQDEDSMYLPEDGDPDEVEDQAASDAIDNLLGKWGQ